MRTRRTKNITPVEPFARVAVGDRPDRADDGPADSGDGQHQGGWGHRLMMLICCVPMLILVVSLVASGAAGGGALVFALVCIGMMAAMMFLMPGGHRH